ncbi:MAG: hypothetical protein II105_02370 [Ruminococcus sp.]|nr:hypothetical protein [Ruminococcus sp.]
MKIRRNITKTVSVFLCAALLTVAMATSAFAAAPTESGMIDIAVSDSDAAFVANHLDALETVRDGALKLKSNIDISDPLVVRTFTRTPLLRVRRTSTTASLPLRVAFSPCRI